MNHVVATAGHVDHGKSALVQALTGRDPDRLAEEKRRGLTLDLGFAWTDLDGPVAFVDVPGHEKFVPTMLAGVGSVPVVMLVVAADGGWMPQSQEHLAAVDALGVSHGLLVVTRSDLADPGPARAQALDRISRTSLGRVPAVACSSVTGAGVDDVRSALRALLSQVPAPDPTAPVRLWVDRSFSVAGAGTVVTGTLAAGRVCVGDELLLGSRAVHVKGLQTRELDVGQVEAVARVAVNLRGIERTQVRRGDALVTPGTSWSSALVDVSVGPELPARLTVHVGSAAVPARVRVLGEGFVRLRLERELPLRVGDRLLLREPARHEVLGAAQVLDVDPPGLDGRGAGRRRAGALGKGFVRDAERGARLRAMGVEPVGRALVGDWYVDPEFWVGVEARFREFRREFVVREPLSPGPTAQQVSRALGLPSEELASVLLEPAGNELPVAVASGVEELLREFSVHPFAAPDAARLAELGLGRQEIAAAVRVGRLVRVGDVVLAPGFTDRAVAVLSSLASFSVGEAARALGTSRRVAVPVLEELDRRRITVRDDQGRRTMREG